MYSYLPPDELPSPSHSKIGWPWTQNVPLLPHTMPDGAPWPRISIVTPSYNQAQFIEETIRSVLLQGYPNLEYLIIDGGSTDGTVEIIKKYEPWLAHWVSEKDRGQSHAINKGFQKSSGDILAWINSDDYYLPNAFAQAIEHLAQDSTKRWVIGKQVIRDQDGEKVLDCRAPLKQHFMNCFLRAYRFDFRFNQPASFWKRSFWQENGSFHEKMHYAFDSEWFLRAVLRDERPVLAENAWAVFRIHANSKTNQSLLNFRFETALFLINFARLGKLRAIPAYRLAIQYLWKFARSRLGEKSWGWRKKLGLVHK